MTSVLLAFSLFLLQGIQEQAPASIDGTVVRAGTTTPVVGARVSIGNADVATDDNGRFSFRNLQSGRYRLFANHIDYMPSQYGERSRGGRGADIAVAPGEAAQGIVLALIPKASISGRVFDQNNAAVPNVLVEALRYAYQDGRRMLLPVLPTRGQGRTNERGEYSLAMFAPGPYIVRAVLSSSSSISGETRLPVYFPGTTNASMASVIDLPPGIDFNGIDLKITGASALRVSGRVINGLTGEPPATASLTLVPRRGTVATGSLQRAMISNNGTFEFRNMAPGSYDVVGITNFSGERIAASAPVEVVNADIDNVSLVLQPQISITGRISLENVQPESVNLSGLRLELRHEPYIPELLIIIPPVAANGTFTLTGVTPGDYRLKVSTGGSRGYVKSARYGAIDALNPPFHIDGPGQFEIVMSLNSGSLDSTVLDRDDKPIADATVVLVPDPPYRQRFDLYYAVGSNASGHAHFDALAPGDYRMFAWDDVPADAWQDPDFMRAYEDRGKPVRVNEGSNLNVDLRLISRLPN